jgi:hypothetical protein
MAKKTKQQENLIDLFLRYENLHGTEATLEDVEAWATAEGEWDKAPVRELREKERCERVRLLRAAVKQQHELDPDGQRIRSILCAKVQTAENGEKAQQHFAWGSNAETDWAFKVQAVAMMHSKVVSGMAAAQKQANSFNKHNRPNGARPIQLKLDLRYLAREKASVH